MRVIVKRVRVRVRVSFRVKVGVRVLVSRKVRGRIKC